MSASRGATPRGIGRSSLATSSPSSASIEGRRNPRRYTTEDIDREIAAYKEESDSDEDDEKDDGDDDDDIGKKKKKKRTTKKPSAVARGGGKRKVDSSSEGEHNDDTNDTEDDESDDSSDFGVASTMKKKSAMTTQQKRGTPKKKKQVWNDSENSDNDDDDDEEDDDNDSDSSSDFGGKKKKKTMMTPSKSKTARSAGRKGGGRSPTTEMIKTPTPRKQPRTATIRGASARRRDKSINDDNEEDIVYDTTPSGSRRPRRQCKTETLQRMSDTVAKLKQSEREALGDMLEDDDKELLFGGSSNNDDDDEDDDVNDDEVVSQKKKRERAIVTANGRGCNVVTSPSRTGRKKLHEDEDDEDYNYGDSSSNASDDSDNNASDDNDDDDDDDIVPKQRRNRVTAKKSPSYLESDEEIGTADEDSDDKDTAPAVLTSPTRKASNGFGRRSGSPNVRARARMGRTPLNIHESKHHNKFSNESSDDDSSNDGNKRSRTRIIKPTCITCSSTTDNITMANLPRDKPHVCYIAPDGKTRHCYTLDTLYRIAISSKDNGSSTSNNTNLSLLGDVRSQTSSLQFLQPPHFRLPMEDDLLDQIASRFGRAALLIESSIMYKRLKGSTTGELDDFDEDGEYIGGSSYASRGGGSSSSSSITRLSFHERFEKYMQSLMGSADVYCCPLCFNEADRRLGIVDDELLEDDDTHNNDDDDDNNVTKDRFSFMDDPLTILGSLDSDEFISASSFCFRYLTGVKAHMNTMHGVNVKDIVGNDLFKRFQIRAPDGLLQNWIKRSLGHRNISVQGDMMRYWLGGGNQSFILLLNQIDKGDARGDVRSDFSLSFPNRAKKIWRDVSAPYLKQHDLGDFIAEEGDDDDESEGDVAADLHVNPNFTPSSIDKRGGASFKSPEEQLISHLQKRNSMKKKTFDSSDDDSSNTNNDNDGEDEDEDDDELEILPKPPQYEDIEEEEMDEWTQSKLLKAKKAKQGSQESKDTGDDDDDDVELFDSNIETDNTTNVNGSAICKRLIIDDEDTNSVPDSGLMAQPEISIGSSRKRTIAESSDDEESF